MFVSLSNLKFLFTPNKSKIIPITMTILPKTSTRNRLPLEKNRNMSEVSNVCPQATQPKPRKVKMVAKKPKNPLCFVTICGSL